MSQLENIKQQINRYFSDTTRSQEETAEGLEDIASLIEMLLESIS